MLPAIEFLTVGSDCFHAFTAELKGIGVPIALSIFHSACPALNVVVDVPCPGGVPSVVESCCAAKVDSPTSKTPTVTGVPAPERTVESNDTVLENEYPTLGVRMSGAAAIDPCINER